MFQLCISFLHQVRKMLSSHRAVTDAAFTWNQTEDGGRRLVNIMGKNKQSDGVEDGQNETQMTMYCYGDVTVYKEWNKIYLMKLFRDNYFM